MLVVQTNSLFAESDYKIKLGIPIEEDNETIMTVIEK